MLACVFFFFFFGCLLCCAELLCHCVETKTCIGTQYIFFSHAVKAYILLLFDEFSALFCLQSFVYLMNL